MLLERYFLVISSLDKAGGIRFRNTAYWPACEVVQLSPVIIYGTRAPSGYLNTTLTTCSVRVDRVCTANDFTLNCIHLEAVSILLQ